MLGRLEIWWTRQWEWFKERAHGPHALFWLIVLSVVEPIFSPIMPETLMVPIVLAGTPRWKFYATITAIFATIGVALGYFIGLFLFGAVGASLIDFYHLGYYFGEAQRLMGAHAFSTMFWVSFTPLPDKVFVLAAGFLSAPFGWFLLGSFLGRISRTLLLAYLVHKYGEAALVFIRRYFLWLAVLAAVIIATVFLESSLAETSGKFLRFFR